MITFPATIHCNYKDCANKAKVIMVYLGNKSSNDDTAISVKSCPVGWHAESYRYGRQFDCCPEHNPEWTKEEPAPTNNFSEYRLE